MTRTSQTPEPTTPSSPWWRRLLLRAAGAYALWLLLACLIQRKIVFPRGLVTPMPDPGADMPGVQKSWLSGAQGRVEVWFIPGERVSEEAPGPAVIFAHGNAELIDHQGAMVDGYRRLGVSTLLVEWPGYGRSDGSPSQSAITQDLVKAYDQLVQRPEVDPERIVFHGRSLGTGAACALAKQRPPAALILCAPMRSVAGMAGRLGVPPFLVWDPFDNAAVVREWEGPLLILHGRRDEVIAFSHGQRLSELATRASPKEFVEFDCKHNDFPVGGRKHWRVVREFLEHGGLLSEGP